MAAVTIIKFHAAIGLGQQFQAKIDANLTQTQAIQALARYAEICPERSTFTAHSAESAEIASRSPFGVVTAIQAGSFADLPESDTQFVPPPVVLFFVHRIPEPKGGWKPSWFPDGAAMNKNNTRNTNIPVTDDASVTSSESSIAVGPSNTLFGEDEDW